MTFINQRIRTALFLINLGLLGIITGCGSDNGGAVVGLDADVTVPNLDGAVITVDAGPPFTITSTSPPNGGTNIPIGVSIGISFSAPVNAGSIVVTMDPPTILTTASVDETGTSASFLPIADLRYDTTYNVTIMAQDKAGRSLSGIVAFSFKTVSGPDRTPPTLVASVPAHNATAVPLDTTFTLTFSEPLDLATLNIVMTPAVILGMPVVNMDGAQLVYSPAANAWQGRTNYKASITAKDLAGNEMAPTLVSFTMTAPPDSQPPTIVKTSPDKDATGVAINTAISIVFSEKVDQASFLAAVSFSPALVCDWTWSADGTTPTCKPKTPLAYSTSYRVDVSTAVKDLAGNALAAAFTFKFTTGAMPDVIAPTIISMTPNNGAIGVDRSASLVIAFSEAMNRQLTQAAISVLNGNTPVPGTFSWDATGKNLTFKPTLALDYEANITWSITTSARDLAGNQLAANRVQTFRVIRLGTYTAISDAAVDGYAWYYGATLSVNNTNTITACGDFDGFGNGNYNYRGLFSFNIAALPANLTSIINATLGAYQTEVTGTPYAKYGTLELHHVYYGPTLVTAAFDTATLGNMVFNLATTPTLGFRTVLVTTKVQDDFANRAARGSLSQFRLQFNGVPNSDSTDDIAKFATSNNATASQFPYLQINYEYP